MPLRYYRSIKNAEVAVWSATETLDFYKAELEKHHFPTTPPGHIKHPEKLHQWYASRYLLCELFPNAIQLSANRKPVLFNGPEISISHSGRMVAVMVSAFKSGIDIQLHNDKLERIQFKFVNPEDLSPFQSLERTQCLGSIWALKEATFKRYVTELPFKQIHIESMDFVHDIAQIRVERKGQQFYHKLALEQLDDLTLAYLIE